MNAKPRLREHVRRRLRELEHELARADDGRRAARIKSRIQDHESFLRISLPRLSESDARDLLVKV